MSYQAQLPTCCAYRSTLSPLKPYSSSWTSGQARLVGRRNYAGSFGVFLRSSKLLGARGTGLVVVPYALEALALDISYSGFWVRPIKALPPHAQSISKKARSLVSRPKPHHLTDANRTWRHRNPHYCGYRPRCQSK